MNKNLKNYVLAFSILFRVIIATCPSVDDIRINLAQKMTVGFVENYIELKNEK